MNHYGVKSFLITLNDILSPNISTLLSAECIGLHIGRQSHPNK